MLTVFALPFVVLALAGVAGVYVLGSLRGSRRAWRMIRAAELRPGMTLVGVPDGGLRFWGERVKTVTPSDEPGGPAVLVQVRWSPRWCWTFVRAELILVKDAK
jgi:hypothetical protein